MRIVIAGAGAVGTHLAKLLCRERHDIILLDEMEERLSSMAANFDLMTVQGNCTSMSLLKEINIESTDLFVAVTPEESQNILACSMAKHLGAKKTLARVSQREYASESNLKFMTSHGVDAIICPENLAAEEIAAALKTSWVRQYWEFANGALVLIGVKIRETAEILNRKLCEIGSHDMPYHVAAIKRGNKTLIPGGQDQICLYDIVYFTTTKKHIPLVRRIAGKQDYRDVHRAIFLGGSRISARTALILPESMQVSIIEKDPERCRLLSNVLPERITIINADGRDADLLEQEGIRQTDAYVALTGNSETNTLSCLAAKRMGVEKTVAEVENLDYMAMAESLDIGTIINKKLIAASKIHQMMLAADVNQVKCLTFADADVVEFTVKKDAPITRKPIMELNLPKSMTIGGLVRKGEGIVVTGKTQILPEDHVIVFCLGSVTHKIEKFFL